MLRSEAINEALKIVENQAKIGSMMQGMPEDLIDAHLLIRREEAIKVIGEYLDVFVSAKLMTGIEFDPVEETEESEDTPETSEETSED